MKDAPVIFLSHHKCATEWLRGILKTYTDAAGKSLFHSNLSSVFPEEANRYDYIFLTNSDWNFCEELVGRVFHIIRNPLSIVVSAYYSHLNTHNVQNWPLLSVQRERLKKLCKLDGLKSTLQFLQLEQGFYYGAVGPLYGLNTFPIDSPKIVTIRMEDLVTFPKQILYRNFEIYNLTMSKEFEHTLSLFDFSNLSGMRKLGEVDNNSHYRSGNHYDWVNHLPYELAYEIYKSCSPLIDNFYPEISRLFAQDYSKGI